MSSLLNTWQHILLDVQGAVMALVVRQHNTNLYVRCRQAREMRASAAAGTLAHTGGSAAAASPNMIAPGTGPPPAHSKFIQVLGASNSNELGGLRAPIRNTHADTLHAELQTTKNVEPEP